MKPKPRKLPSEKTRARLSSIGRRGAEIAARNRQLASEGIDRPAPSLPRVAWLERPDPWADLEKETAGKPLQSPSRQQV